MDFKYYEIEFDNGEKAFVEGTSYKTVVNLVYKLNNCRLTGRVYDEEAAFSTGYYIYF